MPRNYFGFNLRIEILIIGRRQPPRRPKPPHIVSISELRFLSLVAYACQRCRCLRSMVSISELRFLSLVADKLKSENNAASVSISELRFLSLVVGHLIHLWGCLTLCFNLRIEILIIGRGFVGGCAVSGYNVSISELRFLSLVVHRSTAHRWQSNLVSISELRFLSLVALNLRSVHPLDYTFQSQN